MDSIIPSNLIDQLIELSSLSEVSKFLIVHSISLGLVTLVALIPFFVTGLILSVPDPKYKHLLLNHKIIVVGAMSPFLILFTTMIIGAFVEGDIKKNEQLSKQQMTLVKSIQSPIFQDFVKDSIKERGATISTIETALRKYEYYDAEKEAQGMELYNSVDPK